MVSVTSMPENLLKLKTLLFKLDGVGNCEVKNLRCDEVQLIVDGVGKLEMNVNCNTIKAKVDGVGEYHFVRQGRQGFWET